MGVYIKGMEMPKACVYRENGQLITCPLYDIEGYCGALNTEASHKENGKLSDCPLVEIPPHGRLGDLDALHKLLLEKGKEYKGVGGAMLAAAAWCIANAPTVIEEDEGE